MDRYYAFPSGAVVSEARLWAGISIYKMRVSTLNELWRELDRIFSWCVPIRDDLRDRDGHV